MKIDQKSTSRIGRQEKNKMAILINTMETRFEQQDKEKAKREAIHKKKMIAKMRKKLIAMGQGQQAKQLGGTERNLSTNVREKSSYTELQIENLRKKLDDNSNNGSPKEDQKLKGLIQ